MANATKALKFAGRAGSPSLNADPLKFTFGEMKRQGKTYMGMEFDSGVLFSAQKAWRPSNRPGVEITEACLGALGWDLIATPRPEHLPAGPTGGLAHRGR